MLDGQQAQPYPPTPEAFLAASSWLSGHTAAASLANDIKLELYGTYKYVTAGPPTGGRPSIFYPTPRAKYDAWASAHAKYSSMAEGQGEAKARERYIAIARDVGWQGEGLGGDAEEEIDFEDDSAPAESSSKGGMGPRVSVMTSENQHEGAGPGEPPNASNSASIHDAVVDDRIDTVKRVLQDNPGRVNETDEMGNTPLHLAVDRGHRDIVSLLLASGADKTAKDEDGQTPLQVAEILSRTAIAELLQ